jgi:hypothetical protein
MPHIFRFHAGRNNNIYDWTASDRIQPADVRDVMDKTNILTSSAGTSIPTPIARMFLFKTAFEIVAAQVRDNQAESKSIYSGLVSETLDLLELLYKSGSDENKFRYQKWLFDNSQQDDNVILRFFGNDHGHRLLAESFKQATSQAPFNNKIEITLIYYKEGNKEILVGGTSPFSFVFTSPNFKRKMHERGFRAISGLISNDILFDSDYKQLHERDDAFIKYIESLATTPGIGNSFSGFAEYVINTRNRNHNRFNGMIANLQDIQFSDIPLSVSNIQLKQLSEADYQTNINLHSDFKIELPVDTNYTDTLNPLFLLDKMSYDGQYSSPSSHWSPTTRVSENEYPENILDNIKVRELPGIDGFNYPFLSSFDFFERCLIKLPGYALNDERFLCLANNQTFIYPIKPIFFHFFPISKISNYVSFEVKGEQVTLILKIPVFGPTKNRREFICRKTYDADSIINYSGILGIFPLTKATQTKLLHINKYTVASFEKTNEPLLLDSVKFFKKSGIHAIVTIPFQRSNYDDINTKTTYYQINESFDIIQLNFRKDNSDCGGIIIPKFKEIDNGTEQYIYAIDFGTSNTHVEYGRVVNDSVTETAPFSIDENSMQMTLLNKPKEVVMNDGAERYNDYERSMGFKIDTARKVTLREFVPFQIGNQKSASVKFPFRTATCESNSFIANHANNRLFLDANIGFNIDDDAILDNIRYKTDLKWLLERANNDQFNINRVSIFFRELLLLIRTKVLLEENNLRGDINQLKIALSFPISMGIDLRSQLIKLFENQRLDILGINSLPLREVSESIAPYYQLKYVNANIQNDSFCNIDIGGGTTDIVLIDRNPSNFNELYCYCSSFKFAGKQLWSSGSNEFNLSDNGFVSYYKNFIERTDANVFGALKRVLNSNSNRTEDVVGLLFSQPEYKFIDIFSDNKELKVVPLIHYTAILYYITRLVQLKNVELPRTISFSGKGSEYLSLVFPSNNDLKGYTQRVLGIFAGKPTRSDFGIERSNEPKVITAKGCAHFANERINQNADEWGTGLQSASNEKILTVFESNYKGFKNQAYESIPLAYSSLAGDNDYYSDIMISHLEFFTLLFDDKELCNIINKRLEIKDFSKYKQFFIPNSGKISAEGKLRDSFKATLANLNANDKVTDSPFFFPLNYSLIELSREIAASALKS